MGTIIMCDGCGHRIYREGGRCIGLQGTVTAADGISHELFWCRDCAAVAVKAVREAHSADTASEKDAIREIMIEAQDHPGRIITR